MTPKQAAMLDAVLADRAARDALDARRVELIRAIELPDELVATDAFFRALAVAVSFAHVRADVRADAREATDQMLALLTRPAPRRTRRKP